MHALGIVTAGAVTAVLIWFHHSLQGWFVWSRTRTIHRYENPLSWIVYIMDKCLCIKNSVFTIPQCIKHLSDWHIYIYYPLYTNWPITNADLPHVIIQYILYFMCQKLYWKVSEQLSNIGYIGQFQNEATGTMRTRYRRTKAVSTYLMKILSIFLHLRKILICFRIGWFL